MQIDKLVYTYNINKYTLTKHQFLNNAIYCKVLCDISGYFAIQLCTLKQMIKNYTHRLKW